MDIGTTMVYLSLGGLTLEYHSLYTDEYGQQDRALKRERMVTLRRDRFEQLAKDVASGNIMQIFSGLLAKADYRVYDMNSDHMVAYMEEPSADSR